MLHKITESFDKYTSSDDWNCCYQLYFKMRFHSIAYGYPVGHAEFRRKRMKVNRTENFVEIKKITSFV